MLPWSTTHFLSLLCEEAEASPSIGNTLWRLNDVHAFGYNSTGSERVWMKFGALRVYCLQLATTDFGCDSRRSGSAGRFFVFFCQVNNAQLPISGWPHFTNFAHKTWFCDVVKSFRKDIFKIFPQGVVFPKTHFLLSLRTTSNFIRR